MCNFVFDVEVYMKDQHVPSYLSYKPPHPPQETIIPPNLLHDSKLPQASRVPVKMAPIKVTHEPISMKMNLKQKILGREAHSKDVVSIINLNAQMKIVIEVIIVKNNYISI
jgi:hypothetical protein